MGILAPLNIFLRQEIDRMQRVISTVRTTLQDLKLAIDGTIIMSENLRDALDNIYDARVPEIWKKVRVVSLTLLKASSKRLVHPSCKHKFEVNCDIEIPRFTQFLIVHA